MKAFKKMVIFIMKNLYNSFIKRLFSWSINLFTECIARQIKKNNIFLAVFIFSLYFKFHFRNELVKYRLPLLLIRRVLINPRYHGNCLIPRRALFTKSIVNRYIEGANSNLKFRSTLYSGSSSGGTFAGSSVLIANGKLC